MQLKSTIIDLFVAVAAMLMAGAVFGEERISLSYGYSDDGSCPMASHVVTAAYSRDGEVLDIDAFVKTAPAGTDCTRDGLSYDLTVERSFPLKGGWDATAEFGASRQSASATYALSDWAGAEHLVPVANLPAGAAEAQVAAFGISRKVAGVDLTFGVNVVPNDWGNGESRQSLAVRAKRELPFGIDLDVDADFTEEYAVYGIVLEWQRKFSERFGVVATMRYEAGLNDLFNPAPSSQEWVGQVWNEPISRDWASSFSLGMTMDL